MTEQIDHAAEAVNFLGAVIYDTRSGDHALMVSLAQAHATLAVAAQLGRIADALEAIEVVTTVEEPETPDECYWCGQATVGTASDAGGINWHSCGRDFCGIEFRAWGDTKPRAGS